MSIRLAVVASVLVIPSAAFGQQAVQWRVEDGGNGHWYAVRNTCKSWNDARLDAQQSGGELPTLTSIAEQSFFRSISSISDVWIGLFQDVTAPDFSEPSGGWRWITGEPFSFTYWRVPDEPNNYLGNEGCGHIVSTAFGGRWNDNTCGLCYPYGIEWSADCNEDGLVDYGQILDGTLEDTNANGIPDCCEGIGSCQPCPSDLNNDNRTDAADISVLLGFWGLTGKSILGDIDGNGQVDAADLSALLAGWGKCP